MISKLAIVTVMSVTILLLNGCSGGGGSGDASFKNTDATVAINDCNLTNPKTYTVVQNGDTLVKDTTITQVEIIHDSLGNKKVCVLSGSAHIVR